MNSDWCYELIRTDAQLIDIGETFGPSRYSSEGQDMRVDGQLGGFALVDNEVVIEGNERSLTEFFVLRKYRRRGVGHTVPKRIFDELPGKWEVRVIAANAPAQGFWRSVVSDYTGGRFDERELANDDWTGPVFWFENRPG